jgi:hypothetical protein
MDDRILIRRFRNFPCFRKGEAMMRTSHFEGMWKELFEEHHSQLSEVAEILLYRSHPAEQILSTAFAELEYRPFDDSFGKVSAIRAVVKAAIAHNYTLIDSWIVTTSSGPADFTHSGPRPLKAIPWAERAVCFLRDVLHYSRRDTALLLGMSDANIDQLNRFGRRRMGYLVDPPAPLESPRPGTTPAVGPLHSMAFASYE